MTKTLKWLGGGIAAAMLLGLAGLFSGELAEAQPSGPPHRFAGTVTLDGEGAPAGTSVTAIVDGAECGSATVTANNATGSRYILDVPSSCAENGDTVHFQVGGYDAAETGTYAGGTGSEVNLTAESMMEDPEDPGMDDCPDDMNGMGDGMNGDGEGDDGPAEPDLGMNGDDDGDDGMGDGMDDMDDCPDDTGMDDGEDTGMDDGEDTGMDDGEDTGTGMGEDPDPGKTGTGIASTSTSTSLAAILGMMALAIALGGYTYARRRS